MATEESGANAPRTEERRGVWVTTPLDRLTLGGGVRCLDWNGISVLREGRFGGVSARRGLVQVGDGFYFADRIYQRWVEQAPAEWAPIDDDGLPEWATSLDAARRYVHKVTIHLLHDNNVCPEGARDFLSAAGLPTDQEWPSEERQIRGFLGEVRGAALATAAAHGLNEVRVREQLENHGIVKPSPGLAEYTVTFQAPADANVRQVLVDLGWVVRD